MWVEAAPYVLFWSFSALLYMLILSLPFLGLGCKSTSLSPGSFVCRPRQFDTICWELNLISGFFAFFWLIVWVNGINKCHWCLAGCTWFWLKGLHQIPSASWIIHQSLHFHIYHIVSFVPGIMCPLYCYYEWCGDGIGWWWLIHVRVWVGGQGVGIISKFFSFLLVLLSFVSHVLSLF